MLLHELPTRLALPVLFAVAGCHVDVLEQSTAPTPPPAIPAERPATTAQPISAAKDGTSREGKPLAEAGPARTLLSLEQVEGANPARAKSAFSDVERLLAPCGRTGSGPLMVHIMRRERKTELSLSPDGGLDQDRRQCVLSALSTIDYDGVLDRVSPSDRPPGFSAQLRIEW